MKEYGYVRVSSLDQNEERQMNVQGVILLLLFFQTQGENDKNWNKEAF